MQILLNIKDFMKQKFYFLKISTHLNFIKCCHSKSFGPARISSLCQLSFLCLFDFTGWYPITFLLFYFKWIHLRFRHLWINSKNGKISHDFPRHKSSWPNVYASLDSRLWWSFEVREKSAFSMRLEFALITSGIPFVRVCRDIPISWWHLFIHYFSTVL